MKIENKQKLKVFKQKEEEKPIYGYVYYLLLNENVVYVGKSINLDNRVCAHKDKLFDEILYFRVPVNKLSKVELKEIYKYCPIYNKNGVPKDCMNRGDCDVYIETETSYIIRSIGTVDKNCVYIKDDIFLVILKEDYRFDKSTLICYVDIKNKLISSNIEINYPPKELKYNSETHTLEPIIPSVYSDCSKITPKMVKYTKSMWDTEYEYNSLLKQVFGDAVKLHNKFIEKK